MSRPIDIAQGEDAVGTQDNEVIAAILGSCVAVCLWDPLAKVGGMNHLLLPFQKQSGVDEKTGVVAMEKLINAMVHHGARRRRLRAKVFGCASMLSGNSGIGAQNADFARQYLEAESIPCDAESLGGMLARNIQFCPTTGAVTQKFVRDQPDIKAAKPARGNDVELF